MPVWFSNCWHLRFTVIIYCLWHQLFIWLWSYTGCQGYILDVSKGFDKVWHKGLLYKLETYGVKGEVWNVLRNYLHEHYQRVVLNGNTSSWELIKSGVPQVSVLDPLTYLIYINDLPDKIQSSCKIFADHTSLFSEWTEWGLPGCKQLGLLMENVI